MLDSEKVCVAHLLSSFNFNIMQIVRVSVLFIPKPPILSHVHNGVAWPYEMKYIKSYCYFGIYNSPAFMFGILSSTNGIPME